jgi:hypothetical protein
MSLITSEGSKYVCCTGVIYTLDSYSVVQHLVIQLPSYLPSVYRIDSRHLMLLNVAEFGACIHAFMHLVASVRCWLTRPWFKFDGWA